MANRAPKHDWLFQYRLPVGLLVLAIEFIFYFSFAAAAIYPVLLPLHWLLARRFGLVGGAFWALLAGWASFMATWWYLIFSTREHHPLLWPHLRWIAAILTTLVVWGLPTPRIPEKRADRAAPAR